ncbi:MAG: zinc-binding alcohol dehydrogenase [candidate division FCPU426 bacterium]
MKTLRAMLLGPNHLVMEDVEMGELPADHILVENTAGSISTGTELTCLTTTFASTSKYLTWVKYPFPMGYGASGRVLAVGKGVSGYAVGDRVVHGGGHASHNFVNTKDQNLYKIPDGLGDEEASFWHLARTSLNAVRMAGIGLGDCVVVAGLGIIGQFAAQFVRMNGAEPLVALDLAKGRREMAARAGAAVCIDPASQDAKALIKGMNQGRGADILFDATGSPKALPGLLGLVRDQGKIMLTGSPIGDTALNMNEDVVWRMLKLIGAHEMAQGDGDTDRSPWGYQRNGELVLNMMRSGKLMVGPLITHRFPGPDLPKAYEFLKADRTQAVGVVLNWKPASK